MPLKENRYGQTSQGQTRQEAEPQGQEGHDRLTTTTSLATGAVSEVGVSHTSYDSLCVYSETPTHPMTYVGKYMK